MDMSNHFFHFKQFTIHQDRCAMKVSTDSCIQGAWVPVEDGVKHVLDIGTGTGLLSLMLAQRNSEIIIDAVELDVAAANQAKENVAASSWAERISVLQADVTNYAFSKQYDMVICNPPFFNNSLLSDDAQRNQVRHTISLTYDALFAVIQQVLTPTGYAAIILPAAEHQLWQSLLQRNDWCIAKQLFVYPKQGADYNRVVSICTKGNTHTTTETLQIYSESGGYTDAFSNLLQPFYQKL
ncbi:hypothetical protein CAP35_11245 [Chitinophagaceae bacterium IBVUCB1]|nr:hypothetical protein CAP35_11245 [Chitinophagaceae bacterium IBVUCB1]